MCGCGEWVKNANDLLENLTLLDISTLTLFDVRKRSKVTKVYFKCEFYCSRNDERDENHLNQRKRANSIELFF